MVGVIEEFWIINVNGICLFHRAIEEIGTKNDSEDNTQLFSGLLSSILTFYSQLSSSQIQKMEGEAAKFLFFKRDILIYIVRSKLNVSDAQIEKKIDVIQKLFIDKFQNKLKNFSGEIQDFDVFRQDLDTVFKKISKIEKWGKGLSNL